MQTTSTQGNFPQGLRAHLSRWLPSQCAICHAWPASRICDFCLASFVRRVHRCRTCAIPLAAESAQCGACLLHPPALTRCVAVVDYAYPWAQLIAGFKFGRDPSWALSFAAMMCSAPHLQAEIDELLTAHADLILPVPLSATRIGERGFNQALLLAQQIAPRERIHRQLLHRTRHTEAQSALSRADRLRNLRTAFSCDPLLLPLMAGKRVLLIDDVMTTGATLDSLARVVLAAGAAQVSALVLARTP